MLERKGGREGKNERGRKRERVCKITILSRIQHDISGVFSVWLKPLGEETAKETTPEYPPLLKMKFTTN